MKIPTYNEAKTALLEIKRLFRKYGMEIRFPKDNEVHVYDAGTRTLLKIFKGEDAMQQCLTAFTSDSDNDTEELAN